MTNLNFSFNIVMFSTFFAHLTPECHRRRGARLGALLERWWPRRRGAIFWATISVLLAGPGCLVVSLVVVVQPSSTIVVRAYGCQGGLITTEAWVRFPPSAPRASVAQSVERGDPTPKAMGSSPVARSSGTPLVQWQSVMVSTVCRRRFESSLSRYQTGR